MSWKEKIIKEKETSTYRTIYLKRSLEEKIELLAKDNNTSFNNIVISMIEACLDENN